jgi:hypothetical protein
MKQPNIFYNSASEKHILLGCWMLDALVFFVIFNPVACGL